jgi:hypothetical protein
MYVFATIDTPHTANRGGVPGGIKKRKEKKRKYDRFAYLF